MNEDERPRCVAVTLAGSQCVNSTKDGSERCGTHQPDRDFSGLVKCGFPTPSGHGPEACSAGGAKCHHRLDWPLYNLIRELGGGPTGLEKMALAAWLTVSGGGDALRSVGNAVNADATPMYAHPQDLDAYLERRRQVREQRAKDHAEEMAEWRAAYLRREWVYTDDPRELSAVAKKPGWLVNRSRGGGDLWGPAKARTAPQFAEGIREGFTYRYSAPPAPNT